METIVKENWLTQKVTSEHALMSAVVTLSLLLASLFYWNGALDLSPLMAASRDQVFGQREYWRLWTTLWAHGDLRHLVSNAIFFFVLGTFINAYFGSWLFPLAALLFGGVVNAIVLQSMPPTVGLIGASGVVFWMGGLWLTLYSLIETRRSIGQRLLRAGGVGLCIFMPTEAFDPGTSYAAHAWGFLLGVIFALIYFVCRRKTIRAHEVHQAVVNES